MSDPEPLSAFVTPIRMIVEIDFRDGFCICEDEIPPDRLFQVRSYEGYCCDCCTGGENVTLSEHRTLPEAQREAARHPGAWVEHWNPAPDVWYQRWVRVDAKAKERS